MWDKNVTFPLEYKVIFMSYFQVPVMFFGGRALVSVVFIVLVFFALPLRNKILFDYSSLCIAIS